MSDIHFSRELIKGKIGEIIFEQMFRRNGNYTILHFGYEYTVPQLAQYHKNIALQKVIKNIVHAPDFILISHDNSEVYLVEVKYRKNLVEREVKEIAVKTLELWDPSWLFIATPTGFFFEPCNTVVTNEGKIGPLFDKWASREVQDEFLGLLNEFHLKEIG